jgi:tetratricopeptide (TPR) repeat protein
MRHLACMVLLWTVPSAALAQSPEMVEANQRVEEGEQLFAAGDYDGALAQFERAYEVIGAHPDRYLILYNIGQAHERRFRYDRAMDYYRRYLDEGGSAAPDRAAVAANVARLEGLLGTIHVTVNVPRAEVWMDDRHIGDAPGDVLVPGGRHVIEVRATGHAPERRDIQIAPRTDVSESFTLTRIDSALDPMFFGIAAGGTALVALLGAGFGTAVLLMRQDIDQRLTGPDSAALMYTVTAATESELALYALVADIFFVATAVFAATAIVLAIFTNFGGEPAPEQAAQVLPFATADAAGLFVESRW